MKKVFRGLVLLTIVLLLQLTLWPQNEAYANENSLAVKSLDIKVMPEFINPEEWDYNIPSLLVGYHGTITNESEEAYDGEFTIPLPTNLPQFKVGYVAQVENEDQHLQLDYTVNEEEQYISLTPQQTIGPNETFNFIIEYYSAPIEGEVNRNFNYDFKTNDDIQALNIVFYAPYNAEEFKVNKEPSEITSSFGVDIQVFEYTDVNTDDIFDYEVSYVKDSIVTTVEAFNDIEMPKDDTHAGLNEQGEEVESEPFISAENAILIIITVAIVGAFIFIIIRKKQTPNSTSDNNGTKKIINKEEEIKKLRKMLADGKIDEKTYKEKRSKLG